MTTEQLGAILAALTANLVAIILGVIKILSAARSSGERMGRLQTQVDTMWDITVKGALATAIRDRVVKSESPLSLNPEVRRQFGDLGRTLIDFYQTHDLIRFSDSEAILMLAKVFGNDLLKEVCIPYGINMGAALVAALQLCKEG